MRRTNQRNGIRPSPKTTKTVALAILIFYCVGSSLSPWWTVGQELSKEANAEDTTQSDSKATGVLNSISMPSDGIFDPDQILSNEGRQNLANRLDRFAMHILLSPNDQDQHKVSLKIQVDDDDPSASKDSRFPIQIAVALVEGIGDTSDCDSSDNSDACLEKMAGALAMRLHNQWGVGYDIPDGPIVSGGTGVLVLLGIRDRVVFISVGKALRSLLTDGRIYRIIQEMGPDLRKMEYDLGLIRSIDAIAKILESEEEPTWMERILDEWFDSNTVVFLLWTMFALGYERFQRWRKQREQQKYAKAAAHLSELDRARAEALRGSYCPSTTCPICLEDFQSTELGSDGRPLRLLRCGHVFDESCYEEWIQLGNGDLSKCPVCREPVGPNPNSASPRREELQEDTTTSVRDTEGLQTEQNEDRRTGMEEENTAMTRYRQDRDFRLQRLTQLYPRYISSDSVARWTAPNFHGSLAHDASFRSNNPETVRQAPRSDGAFGNNGGSYTFGGGTSGGGKGGRF